MYEYEAEVRGVVDGDTLDLLIDLGLDVYHMHRVRLYGIDTPEVYGVKKDSSEYARGAEASAYVKSNCEGRRVKVRTIKTKRGSSERGKYGRYLAVIFFKSGETWHNLNQQLVELGMAVPDKNYERALGTHQGQLG